MQYDRRLKRNGEGDAFLAKSDDSGRTFSRPVILSEAVGAAAADAQIHVGADAHTVYESRLGIPGRSLSFGKGGL